MPQKVPMIQRIKNVNSQDIISFLSGRTISEVICTCKDREKTPQLVTLKLDNGKEFSLRPGNYGYSEFYISVEPVLVDRYIVSSPAGAAVKISATFTTEPSAKDFAISQRDLGHTVRITKCQLPEEEPTTPTPAPQEPIDIPF